MRHQSEQIVEDIRRIRENQTNLLLRLSSNYLIYKSLSNQCVNYEKVWEAITSIKHTLNEELARDSIIKKLQVYQRGSDIGQDGRYVISNGFDESKLQETMWAQEIIDGSKLLCKYQKISYLYNNVEAYIKIAINSQEAFGQATAMKGDLSGAVFLTNEENIVLASSKASYVGININEIVPTKIGYPENIIRKTKNTMIIKNQVDEHWSVWIFIPSNQLETQVNHAKVMVGFILLGYGICSGIALSLLLRQVFKRLHKLGDKMEQIHGDRSFIMLPENGDEVTVLENKYNSMLQKLENTIDEMAEVKSQKQRFEFKSLESQINPHFLYNTLGVMRWEALECENSKLVAMIDDLTTFYRLSLNKGRGLLNVEQEFKLVKAYINIQQMRWDHVVDVTIHMEDEVKEVIVPKMILQPLVENIWLHGNITAQENRKIEITAKDAGLYIEFSIWDNGDGISEDVIEKFNQNTEMDGTTFGIGIQFIRNILKHYYGDNFKYKVTSNQQFGTLVCMELPKEIGGQNEGHNYR
jgi:two-component system sensor histidine kinase YesM